MKTAWNKDKFLIFLNGFYIGRNHYHVIIPSFDNEYLKKNIIFDFPLPDKSQVDIIYMESDEDMDKTELSNNGETVKITFWLTYTNNEIIDLGTNAIENFTYKFGKNDEDPVVIKPSSNTFTVVYDQKTKKYSFDSTINANITINPITYKFIIQFGDALYLS